MNDIRTKYALVTGASSGIGWHISKELANKGYSIIAISNQKDKLLELQGELERTHKIRVITLEYDLSDINAAEHIFKYCQDNDLDIDVLVNNAGFLIVDEVTNTNPKKVKDLIQLHMNTPVLLCRSFGEVMVKKQEGFILNVSSIAASMPYPTISLYGPSKTFLRQFTKALRIEMKAKNVSVTCLLPGATATALYDDEHFNIALGIKLGVIDKPEYVAKKAVGVLFRKKAECVPGLLNKLIILLIPLIPISVIALIYSRMSRN